MIKYTVQLKNAVLFDNKAHAQFDSEMIFEKKKTQISCFFLCIQNDADT